MSTYRDILLVDEDYIKSNSNLNDNTSGDYILPAISFAQHQYLEETIGTALVRKLQQLVYDDKLNDVENVHYKELLDDYVIDYLAYLSISEIVVNTSFKLNNFGASRTDDEKAYNISYSEVFNLRDYYKSKADYLQYRMQRYLIANYSKYPELVEYKSIADLWSNLYSAASVSIWLGGARNKHTQPMDRGEYLKEKYNFPSNK